MIIKYIIIPRKYNLASSQIRKENAMNFKTYKIGKLYQANGNSYVPTIRFIGKWLENLNFHIGEEIMVCVEPDVIIISKPTEEQRNIINKQKKEKELNKLKAKMRLLEQNK